jgi:hypothetical protein
MANDKLPEISGVDRVYETLYSGSKHFWKVVQNEMDAVLMGAFES